MFLHGGPAPAGLGGPRHAGRLQEHDPLGSAHTQVRSPESAVFSLLTGYSLTTVRPSVAEIKSQRYGLHLEARLCVFIPSIWSFCCLLTSQYDILLYALTICSVAGETARFLNMISSLHKYCQLLRVIFLHGFNLL